MEIAIIFFLTLLNGFFALSEIAFVSVRKSTMEHLASQGNERARSVLKLLSNPENFLSSMQVGITLIGIISGAYGGIALTDDMEEFLIHIDWLKPYTRNVSLVLVVGSITYFSIIIGELVPKSIALNNAEKIALTCVPVIKYFSIITYPFVKFLSFSTSLVLKLVRVKNKGEEMINEDELRFILKTAGKQGVLHKEASEVHQNIFYFSDQIAQSLMTPRSKLEWININDTTFDILDKIRNSIHTKFPVCDNSLDNIKGVITIKDFFENFNSKAFDIKDILEEPIFISQNTSAFNIISQFKKRKQYTGIVVDEYGLIKGMITLKDLTEAIIGDLPDTDEDQEIINRNDGSYLVNGQMSIFDLNQYFKKEIIKDDPLKYTTLAGFILYELKKIPHTGDKVRYSMIDFEVVDMDGKRIDKVLLKEIV